MHLEIFEGKLCFILHKNNFIGLTPGVECNLLFRQQKRFFHFYVETDLFIASKIGL